MIQRSSGLFFAFILSLFIAPKIYAQSELHWEIAEVFSPRTGSFPASAFSDDLSALAWQEVSPNTNSRVAATGYINICIAVKETGKQWEHKGVIAGPYAYSGNEPAIISLVIDNTGRIIIAAAASGTQTEILISDDNGVNFTRQMMDMGAENSLAPRIYVRADGGYFLFVTRVRGQSLSIYYSRSDDAERWAPFEPFVTENNLTLNFLPAHASMEQRDIVFFQSNITGVETASTFQLFYKTSDNGGRTWSEAALFTSFNDPVTQTQASPNYFNNERPHLTPYGNNILLVWERHYTTQQPQIYSAIIDKNGKLTRPVERVNSQESFCNNPIGFIYDDNPTVVWFDNRRGNNRVFLAHHAGFDWQNYELSGASADSSFARPVVNNDGAFIFWQNTVRGAGRIYVLSPDRSVDSPRLTALNFIPSRASRSERVRVSWNVPADPSGILGFAWSWSQDKSVEPDKEVTVFYTGNANTMNLEQIADNDGLWYFSVIAHDFAGNWSEPSQIEYMKKTTPPPPVTIIDPVADENGFLISNNFNMNWEPSTDPFAAGYAWNLQYLGTNEQAAIGAPPSRIMGTNNSVSYENQENGVWGFTVAAIDQAGNIGSASKIVFRTDKFVPYTQVSSVNTRQDEQGVLSIRILGRGFTANGRIISVMLNQENGNDLSCDFDILSDREIGGISLENLEEGRYRLKMEHSARGWYTTPESFSVSRTGTVKFGDYSQEWKPSWIIQPQRKLTLNPVTVLASILVIFSALGAIAVIRGIGGIIAETSAVKQEALAIITGDFMPMEKKKRVTRIQKKGKGLRFKLASFTIALVLLVIIMISTPMYLLMTNTQRETLLQGLWDRSSVLLEGLASSTRAYLPMAIRSMGEQGLIELAFLPAQSAALPEARYITITGYGYNSIYSDHVWATNDPDILSKIDTNEFRPGVSRITDNLSSRYEEISTELNDLARIEAGDISNNIRELTSEGLALALRTDAAATQRLNDIQITIRSLETRFTEILTQVSGGIDSQPQFSTEKIQDDTVFIFFKPVMYRLGSDDNYFRGMIRLEVSLDAIIDAIFNGQIVLLRTILIVALAAMLIGITGAFVLSTLIIRPIEKLVSHIEIIRDTENKAKLEGVDIQISTRDEIATLGNTINDMTHGLVKAAVAASDLSIGKEIQKKFIPLDEDSHGNKQSSGLKETPNLNFFGYYEGAKGVSGDYFDYKDLDGRYYAIIKCDVAGKGIPAALIMIQVATMFLNYFKQWKPNAKGMHIEEVVYQINDLIETLGFKGRFAAFTLCLFDSETGIVRFCNAGDNIVHLYKASEGKLKIISLPTTPATGVLPNFMIESSGGYNVQTLTIDHGDILLLYTDGIEESKRKFRDSQFKEMICNEGPLDSPHENHTCGQADEEMTPERVEAIINAVMAKQVYTLKKYHNPEDGSPHGAPQGAELQFDFSSCKGRVEDVIMAMVSVEQIFRLYKSPSAGEDSRALIDKKVDEFLKGHFLQYRRYCSHTRESNDNDAYLYYTHVKEDEQYDDLTILGIKRK